MRVYVHGHLRPSVQLGERSPQAHKISTLRLAAIHLKKCQSLVQLEMADSPSMG